MPRALHVALTPETLRARGVTRWTLAVSAGTIVVALACSSARLDRRPADDLPITPAAGLELAGQFSIPALTELPGAGTVLFGGISGLAPTRTPGEFLAVSDDRVGHRFYRLRITGEGDAFRVDVLEAIVLDADGRGPRLDPEAIVILENGDLLISSEGRGTQQRVPPAIAQYSPTGAFIRELPIRDRFLPNEPGAPLRGVRANAGFESLTLSPTTRRLFSATETALVQDGDTVTFDHGTMSRVLEYVRQGTTFVPRREFAYPLEAMDPPPFTAGISAAGIVELLAISDDELLALERTFIQVASGPPQGINRVRLYQVSLKGADDISAVDSLRSAGHVRPLRKTLVLDLSALKGLPPDLTTLDNFEGLAFGPRLADGSRSLVVVSDDNFNTVQRTWFLLLRISGR
jgi:hypothetical protein